MINWEEKSNYTVDDLVELVALLRSPEGCPWDREQTHESVRREFLEETCEVIEAIDQQDSAHLKEELGDVLLQVVFHTQMEREAGRFQLDDVADGICKKLLYRHPHVFGQVQVSDTELV
ncbi:MAG: nucleoside triphosphate pyrophosphohydrolase, partial [Oscillospiraceae bacterium]|nr:nucleoside triphosphate pyrophosphohydrolase [Oscillospiraceae bacterium]